MGGGEARALAVKIMLKDHQHNNRTRLKEKTLTPWKLLIRHFLFSFSQSVFVSFFLFYSLT